MLESYHGLASGRAFSLQLDHPSQLFNYLLHPFPQRSEGDLDYHMFQL
jgi:hypothetical protein